MILYNDGLSVHKHTLFLLKASHLLVSFLGNISFIVHMVKIRHVTGSMSLFHGIARSLNKTKLLNVLEMYLYLTIVLFMD